MKTVTSERARARLIYDKRFPSFAPVFDGDVVIDAPVIELPQSIAQLSDQHVLAASTIERIIREESKRPGAFQIEE